MVLAMQVQAVKTVEEESVAAIGANKALKQGPGSYCLTGPFYYN